MNVRALPWFEEDNPHDFARWSVAAAIVVCVHFTIIGGYLLWWHAPDAEFGDDTPIISIELTAPEIDQQEQAKVDEPVPPKETSTDAVIPEEKPPEGRKDQPSAAHYGAHRGERAARQPIVGVAPAQAPAAIQELSKRCAGAQRARRCALDLHIDRNGHVLSQRIAKGSGFADLDAEVLALVQRAQPMPAFPPAMTEERLDLTVPIRFSLR